MFVDQVLQIQNCKSFITMFDDMFDTPEDLLAGEGTQVLSSWERLPRNCADKLPLPEIPRKMGYPMGLKNQGATCYLNSLFQILFHTPQLRKLILQLPLCLQNSQTPSGLVNEARHKFLLGFQRLFSEMSACDQKAVGTEYLNKAFGWEGAQHLQQQDIQEAMRIIFDTIERALFGTEYYQNVRSLFRGSTIRYKTCRACGETAEHPEVFYDLQLQVKGASSVNQALLVITTAEGMQGDNAIFCDVCQSKQDMWLGSCLNQLPGTLVLTLNRFDFDYEKFDRIKLNNYFEYQLQLDLSSFLMPHPDPNYNKYELYGVVIHRGSAHGGHYLCFARDLLHQTDWKNGLAQANAQEARIKQGSNTKNKDKENEDKQFKLIDPENKQLLSNWYQINDNIATAISANKLTSKYEGSDSAYILFYRRKSLVVNAQKIRLPAYFSGPITEANKVMAKEREVYESEKRHIILNINGSDHKLKADTTINDFKQTYIPQGCALVLQHQHNGLPYYPLQIVNSNDMVYQENETLISQQVPHQSKFTTYQILTPQYEQIKSTIGKSRLPFEVVLLVDGENPKRIVAYNDQNFVMLRMKIEKILNIPYEHQVITLVTPYKQQILTQTLTNDEMLLPKLGITHGVQLIIKTFSADDEEGVKEQKKTTNEHLICFVIQRDDIIGLKRFYYQKTKTLQQLLNYFLNMQAFNDNLKRRFRNLNGNRLYYTQHYSNTLQSFDFSEEMVRLRLQRGDIPIKGDICVKIKMQSTLAKTQTQIPEEALKIEKIFDPNTPILEVKEWACSHYHLDVSLHKLYLTDWMTQPVRSLTRQKLTLFQANFGREETLCLRDIYSPIGAELVHLEVFTTVTGSPDNTIKQGIHVKIQEFKTVGELKQLLITTLDLKDVTIERLRLRQIKRDYMFGSVWRDKNKSVKSVTINSNKIVYQILQEPQALTDDQIVLILKERNKTKRIYENPTQIIFEAGRTPNIEQLVDTVKAKVGKSQIYVVKYFHYNFEWSQLSRKNIEALAKNKKTNNQKGKKQDQQKGKNQQKKKQQNVPSQQKKNKEQGKQKNKKNVQHKPKVQKEQKTQADVQQLEKLTQNFENKHPEVTNSEAKGKKQKKGGKNDQHKQLLQECQNLRKAPVLLKDGDILGWGLLSELEGDDLQTDEDLAWRVQLKNQPTKYKGKEAGGFKLNVDF